MKSKKLFVMGIILLVLPLIFIFEIELLSAEANPCGSDNSFLGTFKRGDIITLKQTCDTCTYVNLSSIKFPNSSSISYGHSMIRDGVDYTISFNHTLGLGCYAYTVFGNKVTLEVETIDFEITESGMEKIGGGEGLILVIAIVVILSVGVFFFFISFKFEKLPGKFICISLASIIFLIAILYSLTILTQTFGGFSSLTEGYATFWFVMRIIIGIIITFVTLYCLLLAVKAWNIKRGFVDED